MHADVDRLILVDELTATRGAFEAMSGAHYSLAALNRYVARSTSNPMRMIAARLAWGWNSLLARRLERKAQALSRQLGSWGTL